MTRPKSEPHQRDESVERLDASGKVFGRFASAVARLIQEKDRPSYQANERSQRRIVVTNVSKLVVTGRKWTDKTYYHFSGYPGGLRRIRFGDAFTARPTEVFRNAVRRMLPKNRLSRHDLKRLTLLAGDR